MGSRGHTVCVDSRFACGLSLLDRGNSAVSQGEKSAVAVTTNPALAEFVVCGCCSVSFAASLQHGVGLCRGHVPAGDPVVIVRGDSDVPVPVVDAEQDLVPRQEAGVFEHGIGDLHPGEGGAPAVFGRAICFKCHGNARDVFAACATWFKIGISHDQFSK